MSAIVLDSRSPFQQQHFSMAGNSDSDGNGDGFSEEDLLASLAGFGVEGQVERDLATIKAMLSTNSCNNGTVMMPGRPPGSFGWPLQNNIAFQQQQHCLNNPPPNTPTLSKSMDLYGSAPESQYFPFNASGSRRRDVSLDRSYNGTSAGFPAAASSVGMETDDTMDCSGEKPEEPCSSRFPSLAGHPSGSNTRPGLHYRKQSMSNADQMEGIAEESAREAGDCGEELVDTLHAVSSPQPQASFNFHLASPPSKPSSPASQKRRHRSPPGPISPPQTRSRARQQAAVGGQL